MADEKEWYGSAVEEGDAGAAPSIPPGYPDSISDQIAAQLASNVYESTKSQARGVLDMYGNIDLIRPYFDVEPHHVLRRLLFSLLPRRSSPLAGEATLPDIAPVPDETNAAAANSPDLYGPVMLVFTLALLLLFGLQLSETHLTDGTLLGTSLFLAFSYWLLSTTVYSIMAFALSSSLRWLQLLSITGYSLFGPCISVLVHCAGIGSFIDSMVMFTVALLSASSMAVLFFANTQQKNHAITFAATAFLVHFVFVVWVTSFYVRLGENEGFIAWPSPASPAPPRTELDGPPDLVGSLPPVSDVVQPPGTEKSGAPFL